MNWQIAEVPELRGYTVESAEPGRYYLSRRNILFQTEDLRPPFKETAVIAAPLWKSLVSRLRPAQRLLRFQVTNVVPLGGGKELFVTFDKTVGVVGDDGVYRNLPGLARPCRVLRSACAVDERGDIFFGEYLANPERGPMRVYRYRAGAARLETVFTFPAGAIRHIHGIYFDEYTKALFCLTGDEENECRILRTSDRFKTLETIGQGDETWRAVSLLFDETSLFYGMDAEYRENQIYRIDRATGKRTSLGRVGGTVFYSKKLGTEMFFTTTAENAPSQIENAAVLWHVSPQGECREIAKFAKDFWHPTLFQFGTIHFPGRSLLPESLYFHLVGVRGDNRVFRLFRAT